MNAEQVRKVLDNEAAKDFQVMLNNPNHAELKSYMTLLAAQRPEVDDCFKIIFAAGYRHGFMSAVRETQNG